MNNVDKQYLDLLQDILDNGVYKETRAGFVKSVFGRQMRFNMKDGLPILTTKKVFTKGVIHELLWFLKGDTNIKYLVNNNVHIWDDDAYRHYLTICNTEVKMTKEEFIEAVKEGKTYAFPTEKEGFLKYYKAGDLGEVYGHQWRKQGEKQIDQIQNIIDMLKTNPDDRRMICMAWNANDFDKMALPPCHYGFQVYTRKLTPIERLDWLWEHSNGEYDEWKSPTEQSLDDLGVPQRELSLMWNQRSCDFGLGFSFNLLSYSILLAMFAQCVNMTCGEVICSLGDVHVYENHIEGLTEQLTRNPNKYSLPKLELNPNIKNIDDFTFDDIKIEGYESYPIIKLPLSVGL
nr:thymidylate synthase [Clostridia bacterium]